MFKTVWIAISITCSQKHVKLYEHIIAYKNNYIIACKREADPPEEQEPQARKLSEGSSSLQLFLSLWNNLLFQPGLLFLKTIFFALPSSNLLASHEFPFEPRF